MADRRHGGVPGLDEPLTLHPRLPLLRHLRHHVHRDPHHLQQLLRRLLLLHRGLRSGLLHRKDIVIRMEHRMMGFVKRVMIEARRPID